MLGKTEKLGEKQLNFHFSTTNPTWTAWEQIRNFAVKIRRLTASV
jgi:hypothetical protein